MPPPPLLTGGPGLGDTPTGQSGGGFGWQDAFNIALPLAAGASGCMAGIAPQGNPQTVLQGLSLAHRAQMMPRPDQQAALQRQKFVQELIASGNATPEGLEQIKRANPELAPYIDAQMPAAQDRSLMRTKLRSMMFGGAGMLAYSLACVGATRLRRVPVLLSTLAAWAVWAIVAFGLLFAMEALS